MIRALIVAAALAGAAASVGPAAAGTHGFSAAGGAVRCAVGLPHLAGLFCASSAVPGRHYDGRGVVRLLPSGKVALYPSGSDVLLTIDGNRDGTRRPLLRQGAAWRDDGFVCSSRGAVTCRRGSHGFTLSGTAFVRF